MRINVGSKNEVKVDAVREVLALYNFLKDAEIISVDASSGVSKQPKSIEEIVIGAQNRAKNSFSDCEYSVGIESGLMKVPHTKTGYMDVCICIIYDGKSYASGLSQAFECPKEITRMALEEELDLNGASKKTGLTNNPKLGNAEGIIGVLTKGRVNRKDYTKMAMIMALIQLDNFELY